MKKLLIAAVFLGPLYIFSQDMDNAYINSLPESVRADVLSKIEAKNQLEKPIYRRASSSIDKPASQIMNTRFGAKFFDTIQSTFMPINEPNLDSSYILDFGDVLEIQIIGQKDSIDTYTIERDGSINLLDIGKVILSGLSINDASSLIKGKVNTTYIGTEAFVTLKNIRDINVLIAGNAYNPGIYTLNGNSNILHALSMAGGINNIGSYRSISLIRNEKTINTLDLYQVLVFGKHNFGSGLRSGDSIVVNPVKKVVSVGSGVLRPGVYELTNDEKLSDLINYANGFSVNADKNNIIVKRLINGSMQSIPISNKELDVFELQNGDTLFIKVFKANSVEITGAINNPGKYLLPQGSTLSDLVVMAGGYEDAAYPFGGYLENQRALEVNQASKDKLYNAFLNNLIQNMQGKDTNNIENLGIILDQIKNTKVTGRIIAEFDLEVIRSNPEQDTNIEDGDKVIIPYLTKQVFIHGQVSNPGAIRYMPGEDIEYYLRNSGGLLPNADKKNIFIVHPNGETENLNNSSQKSLSFILAENEKQLLYPGSIIYIPQSSDFTNRLQTASVWAPIISSLALSLTSLSVLNNSNN